MIGKPLSGRMTYIDCDELTVRIAEACISLKRPAGMNAHDAFRMLEKRDHDTAQGFLRAAKAAANYIAECCNANNPGSVEIKDIVAERPGGLPS